MKNFFNEMGMKFQRFMYGRYGTDELYRSLIWIYLIIVLMAIILGRTVNHVLYTIFSVIALAVFIFTFFRVFSKKTEKRRAENLKWLKFINVFKKKYQLVQNRWKYRKTHIFRKCPSCKAVLRMKKVKGTHQVCCPHCKTSFKFKVYF